MLSFLHAKRLSPRKVRGVTECYPFSSYPFSSPRTRSPKTHFTPNVVLKGAKGTAKGEVSPAGGTCGLTVQSGNPAEST